MVVSRPRNALLGKDTSLAKTGTRVLRRRAYVSIRQHTSGSLEKGYVSCQDGDERIAQGSIRQHTSDYAGA